MAKNKISDWDATPANNLDVGGITLAENVMPPSAVNDAFRMMMSQVKKWFGGNQFAIWDFTDPTKQLMFKLWGLPTNTTRLLTVPNADGTLALLSDIDNDPWLHQPIGVPIPMLDTASAQIPPTNKSYRYIVLSAASAYNSGVLTSESVSGSSPLVSATAVISLAGSVLNGKTVRLINTERRFMRAWDSPGGVQDDAFQSHYHLANPAAYINNGGSLTVPNGATGKIAGATETTRAPVTDGTNGTPRTDNETRSRNVGATYFMRIL